MLQLLHSSLKFTITLTIYEWAKWPFGMSWYVVCANIVETKVIFRINYEWKCTRTKSYVIYLRISLELPATHLHKPTDMSTNLLICTHLFVHQCSLVSIVYVNILYCIRDARHISVMSIERVWTERQTKKRFAGLRRIDLTLYVAISLDPATD